jgi:hypothetical protein
MNTIVLFIIFYVLLITFASCFCLFLREAHALREAKRDDEQTELLSVENEFDQTVLIVDPFAPACIEELRKDGYKVVVDENLKDRKLAEAISTIRPSVLVVGSSKVEKEHLNDSLKIVIRAGSGYDNIDCESFYFFLMHFFSFIFCLFYCHCQVQRKGE